MFDSNGLSDILLNDNAVIQSLYIRDGETDLDLNGYTLTMDQDGFDNAALIVGRSRFKSPDPSVLRLKNGAFETLGETYLGDDVARYGIIELLQSTTWNNASNLFVGKEGLGRIVIQDASLLHTGWMQIGVDDGEGTVYLDDGTLEVDNYLSVGLRNGVGSLSLTNGSTLVSHQSLVIGNDGGYGTVHLDDSSIFSTNFFSIGLDGGNGILDATNGSSIAADDFATGYSDGSTGTLNLTDSSITAANSWVGHEAGSYGDAYLSNSSWITSGELQVTRFGNADVIASNNSYIYADDMWIGNFAGSIGTVELTGGSEIQVGHDSNDGILRIGREGDGELTINGGSVRARIIATGVEQGGSGRITLESGLISTDGSGNTFTIGEAGTGYLDMSGGHLVSSNLVFGFLPGSNSTANISGGRMAGYDLELGGINNAIGGNASLNLSGGEIDTVRGYFWSSSTLSATGGTIDIEESYMRGGHLSFANGTYNLGDLLENNGSIELHSGSLSFNGAAPNSLAWYGGNLTALSSDLNLNTTEGFTSDSRIGDGTHGTLRIGGHLSGPSGGVTIVDGGYLEAGSFSGTVSIINGGNAVFNSVLYGNSSNIDLQEGSLTLRSAEPTNRIRINTSFGSTLRDLATIEAGEHVILDGYASPLGATNNLGPAMRLDGGYLRTWGFESFYDGFSGAGFVFDSGTLRIDGTTYVGDGPGMWTPNDLILTSDRKLGTDYLVVENGALTVTDPDALSHNYGSIYFYGGEITIPEFRASFSNNWTHGTLHETRSDGIADNTFDIQGLTQGKTWITDRKSRIGGQYYINDTVAGGKAVFNNGLEAISWYPEQTLGLTTEGNFSAELYNSSTIDNFTFRHNGSGAIDIYGDLNITSDYPGTGSLILDNGRIKIHSGSRVDVNQNGVFTIHNGECEFQGEININGGTLNVYQTDGKYTIFTGNGNFSITNAGVFEFGGTSLSYSEFNTQKIIASGHGSMINLGYINGSFQATRLEITDGAIFSALEDETVYYITAIFSDSFITKPNLTLTSSSILSGSSTVNGNVINNGTVGDQNILDQINVQGDFTQTASGVLDVNFSSFVNHDKIEITGIATLGGTLRIHIGPAILLFEDDFIFLTADEIVGEFDTFEIVGTPNIFELVVGTSGISLRTVPTPSTLALLGAVFGIYGTRRIRSAS
ncbi:MAG: hypothetical protein RLN78_02040 [Phycisphaerales bacterium]